MSIIEFTNLSVSFDTPDGAVKAVKDVSFRIDRGECLGVVGESGAGKSQTFLAAIGLLANNGRTSGSVRFGGRELLGLTPKEANRVRGAELAMIFQDPLTALTPHLTVAQQMAEVLSTHRGTRGADAERICLEWLERVQIAEAKRRLRQYPHELSGGMRQRVMIAMAMLCSPKLLIADEPTTALDATVQAEILDLMARLQAEENTAIALITHDMGVVARMCDRVEVMRLGAFVESGNVEDIFHAPQHDYTKMLLDSMPRLDQAKPQASPEVMSAGAILKVRDLKVNFPIKLDRGLFGRAAMLRAVDGVSFDLAPGETLGIVGESGGGKSTLARAVLRLLPETHGSVTWLGKELTMLEGKALTKERRNLQIVFQDPLASLNPRMTISASIAEPLRTFQPTLTSRERKIKVAEMMERVGLDQRMINRYPHELSGGQNQRVGIARAMIKSPNARDLR